MARRRRCPTDLSTRPKLWFAASFAPSTREKQWPILDERACGSPPGCPGFCLELSLSVSRQWRRARWGWHYQRTHSSLRQMSAEEAPGRLRPRTRLAAAKPAEPSHHGIEKEPHAGRKLTARRDERADGRRIAAPLGQHLDKTARAQIGLDVDRGFQDETAAGERPVVRALAIVTPQPGSGPDVGHRPSWAHQTPGGADAAVLQTVVIFQFSGGHGRAPALEIVRRTDNDAVVVDQLPHDQPGVLRGANPNDDIHAFVDQLHQAIGKREIDRHLWIRATEVATDGADMGAAKRNRRTHPQHALRLYAAMRQHYLGFVDLSQDSLGSVLESLPFFSQRKVTGAAGN